MGKMLGFKVILGTDTKKKEILEALNNLLREHSSRERMDMIMEMTEKEIKEEYRL
jgi:S-ribosylhomocysteine lyase LuxS involved in autoinducer biosynthesis